MALRLKEDALLSVGSGFHPVDLVSRTSKYRESLSAEEAAVAMLLSEGVTDRRQLVEQARKQGVHWDLPRVQSFIERLSRAGLVEVEVTRPPPPPEQPVGVVEDDAPDTVFTGAPDAVLEHEPDTVLMGDPDTVLMEEPVAVFTEEPVVPPETASSTPPAPVLQAAEESEGPPPRPEAESPSKQPISEQLPPEQQAADEGVGGMLAAVALLVCDGKHTEAGVLLDSLLKRDPDNYQARALKELLPKTSRRRRFPGVWIAIVLVAVAAGAGGTLFLIKVPRSALLECEPERIALGVVLAPMDGELQGVSPGLDKAVAKGQSLVVVRDGSVERRVVELRRLVASHRELHQIMKTGGSGAEMRRQTKALTRLKQGLQGLPSGCESECLSRKTMLQKQIEEVRLKLKFCEWQALPKEVELEAKKLAELEARLEKLSKEPAQVAVTAPRRALAEIALTKGRKVKKGSVIARLWHSSKLLIRSKGDTGSVDWTVPPSIRIGGVVVKSKRKPTRVERDWELTADVATIDLAKECKVSVSLTPVSLARSLYDRLRSR